VRLPLSLSVPCVLDHRSLVIDGMIDILFAHDALRGPALQDRLRPNRRQWQEADLAYAESTQDPR
jgi:hypothetical protein